jgi:hypothetical protein
MRLLASILLIALVASPAVGQYGMITLSAQNRSALVIASSEPPTLLGSLVLIDGEAQVTQQQVALIEVSTDCRFWDVTARRSLTEKGELQEISRETGRQSLVLSGEPGEYLIEAIGFDPEKGIARFSMVVTLGTPQPPTPPTPPQPPIPDNLPKDFDELAKRVATWAVGVPKRLELAAVYRSYAARITDDPTLTVATAGGLLQNDIRAITQTIPETERQRVRDLFAQINQDLTARWPLDKASLNSYWSCIAAGLEAGR